MHHAREAVISWTCVQDEDLDANVDVTAIETIDAMTR